MSCCFVKSSKRAEKNIRRYRKNSIHPTKMDKNTIQKNIERLNRECIVCYHCKKMCKLRDNEIKIMCSSCDNFFHCHIAGKCRGKDCTHITSNSTHILSYCLDCVDPMTIMDDTCLCNDCSI